MRFWEIADARNPLFFPYKVCTRTSMIYLCGATGARRSRVWSDHSRISLGSSLDHSRIGIPLWFATVGSFPHCKFGGSLARNAFLRDSRCTKPFVFPYNVCPRTSMIYLCGATGARRSRVWSDHSRIILGSSSDHSRIGIPLWFATVGSFPHCKFGGSLARNAFLRDSRCTKPYVFPYKVCLRTSMIYLCGAIARSSIVFRSSVSADRIVMAASRLLLATAAFVILLYTIVFCSWIS